MQVISGSSRIHCYFDTGSKTTSEENLNRVEVFYAKTKDLISRYLDFKNYISHEELLRASRFHFDKDKDTYIFCHALLRLILSDRLKKKPLDILFINGLHNKPGLMGNPMYFNITHTRDAFAFATSKNFHVGIDLEKVSREIDFISIIETYFSKREREFILHSQSEAKNRFFLLWTRKEALLKALGTGIISNLTQVEASEQENFINKKSFDNLVTDSAFNEHFIYSKKLCNYYLSIAIPHKATINFYHLNKENIVSLLD